AFGQGTIPALSGSTKEWRVHQRSHQCSEGDRMRLADLLLIVPAAAGVVFGANAFFGHDTGVDGTGGALLALFGATAVLVGGLLTATMFADGWLPRALDTLIGLGSLLTAIAAWFLMRDFLAIAMLLAFLGLVLARSLPRRRIG